MTTFVENSTFETSRPGLNASTIERVISVFVLIAVLAAITYGWLHRSDRAINPEHGIGYALGIIGATMMIVLLGYPLRKRTRSGAMGSVGFWFRLHMFLGLAGPLAILFHSRFTFGSLNSAMAMSAMIVVASSGLIGRFLYSRVHRGYSGRKLALRGLNQEMDETLASLESLGLSQARIIEQLRIFETRSMKAGTGFLSGAWAVIDLGVSTRIAEWRIGATLSDLPATRNVCLHTQLSHFFEAARRTAEFAFYDRLLRLWHLLHLPLFLMLVAAAILHVIAVHMY